MSTGRAPLDLPVTSTDQVGMDIRALTEDYAVSPQIAPTDVAAIAAAGFTTLICNRPDDEVPPGQRAADLRAAADAAGLTFVENPIHSDRMTMQQAERQYEAISTSPGPALAYCNSGTRSTVIWMFGALHALPVDTLIAAAAGAGYDLAWLKPQLQSLAGS